MADHPEPLALFDPADPPRATGPQLGAVLRDAAIRDAGEHAPDPWWGSARIAVRSCAEVLTEFTTDDVWQALDDLDVGPPPEPRAMGATMRAAKAAGWAVTTDRTVLSARPECHRRPVRVWRSLLR